MNIVASLSLNAEMFYHPELYEFNHFYYNSIPVFGSHVTQTFLSNIFSTDFRWPPLNEF